MRLNFNMRQLTIKQKNLLRKWKNSDEDLYCWEDLEIKQIEELEKINDTEILSQEVNRFLGDIF
ncbi:hypothetical protein LCGC14_2368740 [marine sediment metagenome]|uniref:Uncharacterized protein n=1 Tax=marine sediment metagenome TaxID=412755 RepID=A0A0F9EGV8_9ZZZZ